MASRELTIRVGPRCPTRRSRLALSVKAVPAVTDTHTPARGRNSRTFWIVSEQAPVGYDFSLFCLLISPAIVSWALAV